MESSAAQLTSDLASALTRFESVILNSLVVIALIALIVVFAVQALKVPLKYVFLTVEIRTWLRRRRSRKEFDAVLRSPPSWLGVSAETDAVAGLPAVEDEFQSYDVEAYFASIPKFLPSDLYLKEVQNRVHQVLERPSERIPVFLSVTSGASPIDQAVTCIVDRQARKDPKWIGSFAKKDTADASETTRGSSYEVAIVAAQDHVAASAERKLDDLQIRITAVWKLWLRMFAISLGVIVSIGGGFVAKVPPDAFWLVLILGAMGGYLSSIVYDVFSIVGRLRPQ